jgi:diacylglycerol kinase (ATP)
VPEDAAAGADGEAAEAVSDEPGVRLPIHNQAAAATTKMPNTTAAIAGVFEFAPSFFLFLLVLMARLIREGRCPRLAESERRMARERGFVVVFNPKAGRGRGHEVLRLVTSRLDGRRAPVIETKLDETFGPGLRERVREIRGETGMPPVVMVVGGDGTLSMVLNALDKPDETPLAIIPCGSGNDFADAIGATDIGRALGAIESEDHRRLDFGIVNGRRFANCVGMGLDAEVGALASRFRARGYPPRPSYYAAAVAGLLSVKPVGIAITAGDARYRFDDGVMVTVGNGPLYGGGFRGAPNAKMDDGTLDIYAFANVSGVVKRLALMQRIRAGTHPAYSNVTSIRAASLLVEFDRDVAMHVDGEITSVRRAKIDVVPGALLVAFPP